MANGRAILEKVENAISRVLWTDFDGTWVIASNRVSDMSAMMRLPW